MKNDFEELRILILYTLDSYSDTLKSMNEQCKAQKKELFKYCSNPEMEAIFREYQKIVEESQSLSKKVSGMIQRLSK